MNCIKCGAQKERQSRCKNCAQIYHKTYKQNNMEDLQLYYKIYYQENKDKIKLYQSKNEDKIRYNQNLYERARKQIDPAFKLRKNCSRLINHALNGNKRGQSMLKYLPYTINELKIHLENQFDIHMNWNNYGKYWHLDHIYPQSLLSYTSMEDENFRKCWALENLQPLEAVANIKKSNKIVSKLCLL